MILLPYNVQEDSEKSSKMSGYSKKYNFYQLTASNAREILQYGADFNYNEIPRDELEKASIIARERTMVFGGGNFRKLLKIELVSRWAEYTQKKETGIVDQRENYKYVGFTYLPPTSLTRFRQEEFDKWNHCFSKNEKYPLPIFPKEYFMSTEEKTYPNIVPLNASHSVLACLNETGEIDAFKALTPSNGSMELFHESFLNRHKMYCSDVLLTPRSYHCLKRRLFTKYDKLVDLPRSHNLGINEILDVAISNEKVSRMAEEISQKKCCTKHSYGFTVDPRDFYSFSKQYNEYFLKITDHPLFILNRIETVNNPPASQSEQLLSDDISTIKQEMTLSDEERQKNSLLETVETPVFDSKTPSKKSLIKYLVPFYDRNSFYLFVVFLDSLNVVSSLPRAISRGLLLSNKIYLDELYLVRKYRKIRSMPVYQYSFESNKDPKRRKKNENPEPGPGFVFELPFIKLE
ncbi:hypothetical protein MXB_1576 [Myxobolus squamalis]|nr:hypothetical protein MXB_1576 [Myxobolus squamalis]